MQIIETSGPNSKSKKKANMCHSGCVEDLSVIKTKSRTKLQGQKETKISCKTRKRTNLQIKET